MFRPRAAQERQQGTNNKANGSMKFTGTKDYVATDDLKVAVNASIVL